MVRSSPTRFTKPVFLVDLPFQQIFPHGLRVGILQQLEDIAMEMREPLERAYGRFGDNADNAWSTMAANAYSDTAALHPSSTSNPQTQDYLPNLTLSNDTAAAPASGASAEGSTVSLPSRIDGAPSYNSDG